MSNVPSTTPILHEENRQLKSQVAAMSEQLAILKHQNDWFKRQLFGSKSEKQLVDTSVQPLLDGLDSEKPSDSPSADTNVKTYKRRSQKQRNGDEVNDTGLRFDDTVPQQVIELSAPELEGEDAEHYEVIDHKETVRLAQQSGSYTVLIYRRPVVRHKPTQSLTEVAAPSNVLEGCYADVSLIAGLMVDKAVYHLPLYRQHQRMLDSGIQLSRATLTNWFKKGIELLRPIYQAQWRHVLQSKVLAMDEVPIKAGRKSKGKMKQTYYWPIYGESDEVVFTWSSGRGYRHAVDQLTGFNGTLLTDGFSAYEKAIAKLNEQDQQVVHAACWVHGRRTLEKALSVEPAAQTGLDFIAKLYRLEKQWRDENLTADLLLERRQKESESIVTELFVWIYQQRQRVDLLPSNPLSKGLVYLSERQAELKVFLSNPHVPMDTNHLERSLRVIPMGRKNFLFCWTEIGAEHLGILQSLMVTCRLQGINPYHYLVDVLQRISCHPNRDIVELTPRLWKTKFGENFLTSDLNGLV